MAKRKAKPVTVSEVLRQAIRDSGQSTYRIAKDAGLSYAVVWRFVAGERALSQGAIDKLCASIGLRLVPDKPKRA